jgi:hypothetical protein
VGAFPASLDHYEPLPVLNFSDVTSALPGQAFGDYSVALQEIRAIIAGRAGAVLDEVSKRHRAGQVVSAADTLLHYLVDLLDEGDMSALNMLLGALRASLKDRDNADLYDDRGLARLHNALALTLRHADKLPGRAALRAEYRDAVARREGVSAADNTVKLI